MTYEPKECPECGELASATEDTLFGSAQMYFDEKSGGFEYAGETTAWWDSQTTITDEKGNHKLRCPNEHNWFAKAVY